MDLIAKRVVKTFERITGHNATSASLVIVDPRRSMHQSRTSHPLCQQFAESPDCRRNWQAHLLKLKTTPEPHWHHCERGYLCAIVPLVCEASCEGACHLVCRQAVGMRAFEQRIELLTVLMENLAARLPDPPANAQHGPATDNDSTRQHINHPQITAALAYIDEHLTDPSMTVASVARTLDVNATYLAHLFRTKLRMRMSRYIATRRVEMARRLLTETNLQIKRVAFECGYTNADWFSEVFRAHGGVSPSEFRRSLNT